MTAAAIAAVEADGYSQLTVAKIIERARISRKTFYDIFSNSEDCFLAAFEQTLQQGREIARDAYAAESEWRPAMRAAVLSLLRFMDEERGLARLCVVDALVAGPPVLRRRAKTLQELAQAIDLGRALADPLNAPQPLTAPAILGGVCGVLHQRLLDEDPAPLTDLLGPLMSMIVMPYLGLAAANEEFKAPSPPGVTGRSAAGKKTSANASNPLEMVDIRLTYRTVRVLTAIAEAPGASNRQIAQDAGIVDPGQISKLLRRLAGLELIENAGPGHLSGASNAWRLTDLGAQLQRATRGR